VYKFTVRCTRQNTFEKEFQHNVQVQECDGVPELVTRHGRIRGLLLSFINGQNLADEIPNEDHLWDNYMSNSRHCGRAATGWVLPHGFEMQQSGRFSSSTWVED
jgi:hypothetical protein